LSFGIGTSRYRNCCIDGGTSPEYFGYHLVHCQSCYFTEGRDVGLFELVTLYVASELHEGGRLDAEEARQ
jgi:hypothetical protein